MKYTKPFIGWYLFFLSVRSLYLFNDLLTALSLVTLSFAVLNYKNDRK